MTDPWIEDSELDAVLMLLSTAVAGHPDADTGQPIGDWGVGSNAGARFQNDTFALRDYCWCDGGFHPEPEGLDSDYSGGEGTGCPVNFEHFGSGITGIWYKHLGRDQQFSRSALPGEALDVLLDCLVSLGHRRGIRPDWSRRAESVTQD